MQQPEAYRAIHAILREHRHLSAVVDGMTRFADALDTSARAPAPMVLRAMLYYIREYPERVHHPKEDKYLFAPLRLHTNDIDDVIDQLEAQHVQGERRVRDLERALTQYEVAGESAIQGLQNKIHEYAAFYANHRRLEEDVILPAALRCFTAMDWIALDQAFAAHRDPFSSSELAGDLDHLYSMILNTMPDHVASFSH